MKQYKLSSVLLSPDAAEGNDPLAENVNDVDTSYPILPAGYYMLKIGEVKKEPTKAGDGERLTIPFTTVEETETEKGVKLPPGHQITLYIGLTERVGVPGKRDYNNDSIKKSIAPLARAAKLNCSVRDVINNPSKLDGNIVRAKVKINPETESFGASNGIAGFADSN